MALVHAVTEAPSAELSTWLRRFHEGDRDVIEAIYRTHFATVHRAVRALASAADRETVIHEIFLRLLTQPALRAAFHGGNLAAWLVVVSRNHAIDFARHRNRELPVDAALELPAEDAGDSGESGVEAKILIDRFRAEVLPAKWAAVFEARFIKQVSQDSAASALGMGRTTLAYQEARVRRLLRRFLRRGWS